MCSSLLRPSCYSYKLVTYLTRVESEIFLFLYPKTQSRLTSSQLCNCWDYPYAEKKTFKQTKNQNQTPHSISSLPLFPQWLLFQICHCFISIFLSNCIVILQPKENHTSPEFCIPSEVHPSVTSFPVQKFCGFMPLFSFLNYCHFPKLLLLPQSACTVGKCCRDMKPLLPLNLCCISLMMKKENRKKKTQHSYNLVFIVIYNTYYII